MLDIDPITGLCCCLPLFLLFLVGKTVRREDVQGSMWLLMSPLIQRIGCEFDSFGIDHQELHGSLESPKNLDANSVVLSLASRSPGLRCLATTSHRLRRY